MLKLWRLLENIFSCGINRLSSKVRKDKSYPFEELSQVFDGDSLKSISSFQIQGMSNTQCMH